MSPAKRELSEVGKSINEKEGRTNFMSGHDKVLSHWQRFTVP
jgi:hypothetical protein